MRILLAQINPIVGDLDGNYQKIIDAIRVGQTKKADIVVLPELALSGYPPEDFLLLPHFTRSIDQHLEKIVDASENITVIVGTPKINPLGFEKNLCNSAAIINNRTLVGFQDKILLPTYDVFDERRYFEPGKRSFTWELRGKKIGITICEDIWHHSKRIRNTTYCQDPVEDLVSQKPDLLINLSASPFRQQRCHERIEVCGEASKSLQCPVLLCNQVGGNDSLIFDGYSLHVNGEGKLCKIAKGFQEDFLLVDLEEECSPITLKLHDEEELFKALVLGLSDYFRKLGFDKACLGVSGGIDSAVVSCIAAEALGKENVLGISLPSRFNPKAGQDDALQLMKNLDIDHKVLSIEKPFQTLLDLLEPEFEGKPFNVAEENLQARIRGMILMTFSNKFGHIVLSTGNKSELAMGYATLYGDMVGGLGVINDVTKMQVYALARWINRDREIIPNNILTKPPSAELREGQLDSDSLPDYAIIDNVLTAYVEEHISPEEIAKKFNYSIELVNDLVQRIHQNEYKRRQGSPGLRVSRKAFSVGRRFPIVQRWV